MDARCDAAAAPPPPERGGLRGAALLHLDVRRGGALGTRLGLVADLRALGERLEAAAGDARVVDEQVFALIVGRDEPEALLVAEPLEGSGCHMPLLGGCVLRNARGARATTTDAGTASPNRLP